MKLIYSQGDLSDTLDKYGIYNCCIKQFDCNKDTYTTKTHHHNDFELHMVTSGQQNYSINGKDIAVTAGECLLIPPKVSHKIIGCSRDTEKLSLVFGYDLRLNELGMTLKMEHCVVQIPNTVLESIEFILKEVRYAKSLSYVMVEGRIVECIILLFRQLGLDEKTVTAPIRQQPYILSMAKGYINDNVKSAPSVSDVSRYCNVSEKQLLRLFLEYEEISTSEYIKNQRLELAKKLLSDNSITIKTISEEMSFGNEYYFNNFFKKAYGMPPGAYRKMF